MGACRGILERPFRLSQSAFGPSGAIGGRLRACLDRLGIMVGPCRAVVRVLGRCGVMLGASWAVVGPLLAVLGLWGGVQGPHGFLFLPSWSRLGPKMLSQTIPRNVRGTGGYICLFSSPESAFNCSRGPFFRRCAHYCSIIRVRAKSRRQRFAHGSRVETQRLVHSLRRIKNTPKEKYQKRCFLQSILQKPERLCKKFQKTAGLGITVAF